MERFGKQRLLRWLGTLAVALVALAAAAAASASHPTLSHSSTFTTDSEGWVATGCLDCSNPMTWQSSGGNPDGYITTDFQSGIGLILSAPGAAGSTWSAGNALGDSGGTLGADVRVTLDGSSGTEDLVVGFSSSNAFDLVCEDFGTPTSSWDTYTVTLDPTKLIDCDTEQPVTGAQLSAALAGFESMFVGADNLNSVKETVDVDNAALSPPNVAATPRTGRVARSFLVFASKAHKLTGWFSAPDDYSCAEKTKLTIFEKGKKPVKVGTVTTSSKVLPHYPATTFSFKLKKSAKGKFYASAAKTTSKLDGNRCAAVTSKSVRVH